MKSDFNIETNKQFENTIETLGIESIISAANVGSSFVFATNDFYPLYYDFESNDYMIFHGKLKRRSDITCIDISDNKKFVVTGHENGMISLWSIPDNFTFLRSFQKIHEDKTSITHIKFGRNSETIYVGDEKGIVTQISITVIIKAYAFREVLVYNGSNVKEEDENGNSISPELTGIIVSREGDPFPIGFLTYENYYVTFDPSAIAGFNFTGQEKKLILYESEKLLNQPTISLFSRAVDYFMNISIGSSLRMLQIRDPNETVPLLGEIKFKNDIIVRTLFLSSSLIAIVLSSGSIQLMLYNGEIVSQNTSDQLTQILSNNVIDFSCYDEKVFIINEKNVFWLRFANWEVTIENMAKKGEWKSAFQSLSEINLDLSCNLIGIPQNMSVRRRKVSELGRKLIIQYFENSLANDTKTDDLLDKIANVTVNITTLDMNPILTENIYNLFLSKDKEKEFFEGIKKAEAKQFALLCSPTFVSHFIEYSIKAANLEECENYLLSLKYEETQIKPLIKVAAKYKLLKLVRHFYLNYLHDCVTPCIFYYEDGRIVEYVDYIFNEEGSTEKGENNVQIGLHSSGSKNEYFMNEKRMKIRETAVIVWLLIPEKVEGGDFMYLRFKKFVSSNWQVGLNYVSIFANLITTIKIRYSFDDTLHIGTLVEAVLETLDSETYETSEPFMNVILPYAAKYHIEIGNTSLRHILKWIFESKSDSADRETVLRTVVKKNPNLIPENFLIQFCERSNFVTFLIDHFMPQKKYTKIVNSMILNEKYRPFIIDFLKERLNESNNSELSQIERNEIQQNVKTVVYKTCQPLLLLDEQKFVTFIVDHFSPKEMNDIIGLLKPPERLIFLLRLREINYELTEEQKMLTFELLLQYRPSTAEQFLTENINDMDINKANDLSIKYSRVDCQVSIKVYLRQYNEATQQVGSQIEKNLLDFIESDSTENPSTIDQLADMKDMKSCMEIIDTSIYLLTTISKDSNDKMAFQKGYFCFLFPMYLAQKSGRENIKQSVTLMFSYFVVGSMNIISPHHAFLIISIHFSHLDNDMYKLILQNVTARINYQKRLLRSLDDMLIIDCLQLIENVFLRETHGTTVNDLTCCVCKAEVDTNKYALWYLYPCGHICHAECYKTVMRAIVLKNKKNMKNDDISDDDDENNSQREIFDEIEAEINKEPNRCPECFISQHLADTELAIDSEVDVAAHSNLSRRKIQRIQRRLQFALKKNFGEKNDVYNTLNSAYFSRVPELASFDDEPVIDVDDTVPPPDDGLIVIKKE